MSRAMGLVAECATMLSMPLRKVALVAGAFVLVLLLIGAGVSLRKFNEEGEKILAENPAVEGASTEDYLGTDIPIFSPSEIISQFKTLTGRQVSLRTKSASDEVLSFYLSCLPHKGWEMDQTMKEELSFKREGKELGVKIVGRQDSETLIEIKLSTI